MVPTATLLLYCEDRKGLVVAIAHFILEHGGNILHADQHQDAILRLFFMRIQWSLTGFDLDQETFSGAFAPLAAEYGISWQVAMGHNFRLPLSALPGRLALSPSDWGVAMSRGYDHKQSPGRSRSGPFLPGILPSHTGRYGRGRCGKAADRAARRESN